MFWSNITKAILSFSVMFQFISCDLKCSDKDVCPKHKPYCSKVGCVFDCPPPFYINGTNCLTSCEDLFVQDRHCVQKCPEKWFEKDSLTLHNDNEYIEKRCVKTCSTSEYVFNSKCVGACPLTMPYIINLTCSSYCPDSSNLLMNISINSLVYYKCVSTCQNFINNGYCVDQCNEMLVVNGTCVDECPQAFPFISEKKCVKTCPPTTLYIDHKVCLQNCSKETPFYNGRTCMRTCPETFYITNRNGIIFCEDSCRDGEYTYKNTCLHSCADDGYRHYYLYYLNKTCQEQCPSGYFEQKDNYFYVGTCVKTCSQSEFVYNGSCVTRCPASTYLMNSTCVHECPANYSVKCIVTNDMKCSGTNFTALEGHLQICVSECPHGTFVFNKTCVVKCPALHSAFGQDCMRKCPRHHFFTHNKTISYKQCLSYDCWYHTTKTEIISECVAECPDRLFTLNSTCVSNCPPSHKYIENRTCKFDGCSSAYQYQNPPYIICTDSCDDNYFILNTTCVEECPYGSYITRKTCHLNKCQSKYIYNTSFATVCINDCSNVGLLNGNVCVEHCPKYVFNGSCVSVCPDNYTFVTNHTSEVQSGYGTRVKLKNISYVECRNECPEYSFQHENQCLNFCPYSYYVFGQKCVSSCPMSKPFYQSMRIGSTRKYGNEHFANVCIKHCKYPRYLNVKSQFLCISRCPNATKYIYQNVCTTGCPKGNAAFNANEGIRCVNKCPSKYVRFNNTCLFTCPKYTYNFNDSDCVYECPKSAPLGLLSDERRCIKSCKSYETFKNGKCIDEADCKEPYFVYDTKCVLSCPDGYFWLKTNINTCLKRWDTPDTALILTFLGVWVLLLFWSRTALEEYFVVLSMILLKTDERDKENDSIDDYYDITVDVRQPLISQRQVDEIEEI